MAQQIGIPLSNLLNAHLCELANTGSVHFTASEPMTETMQALIAEAQKEIAADKVSGPLVTLEVLFEHLDNMGYVTGSEHFNKF